MAWNTLTVDEVLEELSPAEAAMMKAAAGDKSARIVTRAVQECRGAISGGGYPLGAEGTIPDSLKGDTIALARWRWLIAFPQLAKMQTKERQAAYTDAREKFTAITQQDFSPEPPTAGAHTAGGSWNSENKIVGRAHPVPRPSVQQQSTATQPPYANPASDAEQDA